MSNGTQCRLQFTLTTLALAILCGCSRPDAPQSQPTSPNTPSASASESEAAATIQEPPTRWQRQQCTVNGAELHFEMQFPEGYTPLRPFPLIFFYPGTSDANLETRTALLVNGTSIPSAPEGWPEDMAAEDILNYVFNNLNTEISRRMLAIPFSPRALKFACRHAWAFDGLIIRCSDNAAMPELDAAMLGNLSAMPVFIDNGLNPEPPRTARQLQKLLRDCGVTEICAPEFMLSNGKDTEAKALAQAVDFLTAHAKDHPDHDFAWSALRLRNGRVFWLQMDAFTEYGEPGEITGAIVNDGNDGKALRLVVHTENLDAFSIRRDYPGFRANAPLALEVDSQLLALPKCQQSRLESWTTFHRDTATGKWSVAQKSISTRCKTPSREGPIASFLMHPFAIVVASSDAELAPRWSAAAQEFARIYKEKFCYEPQVFADKDFKPSALQGRNLLVIGGPEDNSLTSTLLENDTAFLKDLFALVKEEWRDADTLGCLALYPGGTLLPGQTVLLAIGNSNAMMSKLLTPLLEPDKLDNDDYMLFNTADGKALSHGTFGSDWELR